jgi:hypothetical protein
MHVKTRDIVEYELQVKVRLLDNNPAGSPDAISVVEWEKETAEAIEDAVVQRSIIVRSVSVKAVKVDPDA